MKGIALRIACCLAVGAACHGCGDVEGHANGEPRITATGQSLHELLLDENEPFEFQWQSGNALHGFEEVTLTALPSGSVRGVLIRKVERVGTTAGTEWRRLAFSPTAEDVRRMRGALVSVRFADLDAEYIAPRVADGTQIIATVRAGDVRKQVYCSNRFPTAIGTLAKEIDVLLIAPRLADLAASGEVVLPPATVPPSAEQPSPE